MDNAPAPAPSLRGPFSISAPSSARRTLTRQHRSVDVVGGMHDLELGYNNDHLINEPLSVTTQFQPYPSAGRGPLSNPASTSPGFWNNGIPSAMMYGDGMDRDGLLDYNHLRIEYETAIDKLNQAMNSIKTFWSPELKKERQLRREEASKIAKLEQLLQSGHIGNSSGENAQLRMEIASRDERIRQLTSILDDGPSSANNFSEVRVRELEDNILQLQSLLRAKEHQNLGQIDPSGRFALENALRRIDEKQNRINEVEQELTRLRSQRSGQPRDFTDKSISNHDVVTLRMKLERSELELCERKTELSTSQSRMRVAEEQSVEMRSHLQLLKEQLTNREQQCALLQGDVEALRQKLELKNEQMTQREARIDKLEKDLVNSKNDTQDKTEQMRQSDLKMSQLVGRVEALEANLREKEQELDKAKIRLLSHPDVIREKDMKEKIEQGEREKQKLQEHIDQLRRCSEKDRLEQQDTYQKELRQLQGNVDNLQKELQDRDVLLESQNEKIGDLARELGAAHKKLQDAMVDKGADELRQDVESARGEVEKLLKMVKLLEKDNNQLTTQCKQLQGAVENRSGSECGTLPKNDRSMLSNVSANGPQSALRKRVEELEEALRESVSITAEREVHLSQQKHLLHQVNTQLSEARREISELKKTTGNANEREQLLRSMEGERRQHLEQLLAMKQEAILAAIGEKDAHLALLEKARAPRDEIETIRRQKEALMRKLKQENERRALVVRPESAAGIASVGPGALTGIPTLPQPVPRQGDLMTASLDDDGEGIWA
ncbi:unnamed protein product [Auanema sp. JU1783]|nr:unnamed protein product [Auanema sp. JU1783]